MPDEVQNKRNRPDKVEFEKRLMTVQGWMIDGVPSSLIAQQVQQKGWAKSERHAFEIISKARNRWIKYEDDNRDDKRKLKVQELKMRIRNMNPEYKNTPAGMRVILGFERLIVQLEGLLYLNHYRMDDGEPTQESFMQPVDLSFAPGEVNAISKQLDEEY